MRPSGRFRYNNTVGTGQWEVSTQGGAYVALGTAATAYIQNGNSFGAAAVLGTNDAFSLSFETVGLDRVRIFSDGEVTISGTSTALITRKGSGLRININNTAVFAANTIQVPGALALFNVTNTADTYVGIDFITRDLQTSRSRIVSQAPSANNSRLIFATEGSNVITERMRILETGQILMGLTSGGVGTLRIEQAAGGGAEPVVQMEQADVSEEFIRFIGTAAAATLTNSLVAEADVTTATRQGFVKVFVEDDGNQITGQAYFMPLFTLA